MMRMSLAFSHIDFGTFTSWHCGERRRKSGVCHYRSAEVVAIATFSSILVFAICAQTTLARPHEDAVEIVNNKSSAVSHERVRILVFPRRKDNGDEEDTEVVPQDIVFPDSVESVDTFEPVVRIDVTPECAEGGTFCEEIPSYPYKLVREVLGRSKAASSVLFSMDEADEFAQRIGEPEESFLCGAIEKTVYPKAGQTKRKVWKYIVNQGSREGYVQGVRVETCIARGKPCDLFGSQPNGFITSCKQKFIYRKLVSLSDGGQPATDSFLMPSACCCAYKRDSNFLARFGSLPVTPIN